MDTEKQFLLVELIVTVPKIFNVCNHILKGEYFDNSSARVLIFVKQYHSQYKFLPNRQIIKCETGIDIIPVENISDDIFNWACDEIEKHCRTQAMRLVLLDAPRLLSTNEGAILQAWKDASQISLLKEAGHDYLQDIEQRVTCLSEQNDIISTGILGLDIGLQPRRGELHLVSGASGGGKSLTLGNITFNMMVEGHNVLFISLEMKNEKIAQRIDSIITGVNPRDYVNNVEEIAFKLKEFRELVAGTLVLERIKPRSDCNVVRVVVEKYISKYGRKPDAIVIDYMGRMSPLDNRITAEHTKDEYIADEIREIGVDYDAVMWTGSQMTRGTTAAKVEDIGQQNIAGGIAKLNPVDGAVAVVFNDIMKFAGEIAFKIIKSRNSEDAGKIVVCSWNNKSMHITNRQNNASNLTGAQKEELTKELKMIDNIDSSKKDEQSNFINKYADYATTE